LELCHNYALSLICHFEPFGKLPETTLGTGRTGSAKGGTVILSPALGGTKDLKIPRQGITLRHSLLVGGGSPS